MQKRPLSWSREVWTDRVCLQNIAYNGGCVVRLLVTCTNPLLDII